jgi:hypothetical protein
MYLRDQAYADALMAMGQKAAALEVLERMLGNCHGHPRLGEKKTRRHLSHFKKPFYAKMIIILPRQARDKRGESSTQKGGEIYALS